MRVQEGQVSAPAADAISVPFLVLVEGVPSPSGPGDLRVRWANEAATARLGAGIVGQWLGADRPLGEMDPITSEVEIARRSRRIRTVDRTVSTGRVTSNLRFTVLPASEGCGVLIEDVSAEVRARAELAGIGGALERVERWANLGIWEVDMRTNDTYLSTQAFEILGVEAASLRAFHAVVHPDDRPVIDHVTQRLLAQPGPYWVAHRILRDGETRSVEQHMQSIPGDDGRPARLIGTVIDVTTVRSLQQQVHQGQQMRTLGLLAGGLAHDLINLLLVVRGHSEASLDSAHLDPELRSSLEAISSAAHRGSALSRQLMTLGRQDSLRPTSIDPAPLLQEVAALVHRALRPDVAVDVEIDPAVTEIGLRILVDVDRLRQVLLDLVFNARDAGAGTVRLRLSTTTIDHGDLRGEEQALAPGRYGVVSVVDDGAGMDADTVERIFEPYFTTKSADAGSGLGLANAWAFARDSLGTIVVDSAPLAGTTMSLLLPGSVTSTGRRGQRRPAARRVLVGAAETEALHWLAGVLASVDVQIASVSDLQTLVYSVQTEPIDVVVLETSLAPATWPQALRSVPTVVVSASSPDRDDDAIRTAVERALAPR